MKQVRGVYTGGKSLFNMNVNAVIDAASAKMEGSALFNNTDAGDRFSEIVYSAVTFGEELTDSLVNAVGSGYESLKGFRNSSLHALTEKTDGYANGDGNANGDNAVDITNDTAGIYTADSFTVDNNTAANYTFTADSADNITTGNTLQISSSNNTTIDP